MEHSLTKSGERQRERSADDWAAALDKAIESQFDRMVAVRQRLHAQPEPSGEEFATTQFLAEQLAREGFTYRTGPEGRGLIVDSESKDDGLRIGLRCDMDALRIQDGKDAPYKSRVPGVCHACGHDGHTAAVLGAILGLAALERDGAAPWPVHWRAIFQPAEETNQGALEMVKAGALEDVGGLLGLHMDPSRRTGTAGVRTGVFTADCVELEVRIEGRGGHAARPHESLDPIGVAAQFITTAYQYIPRMSAAHDPAVLTFGHIAGGNAPNAIPNDVQLRGTLRTLGIATRKRALAQLTNVAQGIGDATGARITLRYLEGPPAVVNDAALTGLLRDTAAEVLGADRVEHISAPSMGGEDFANYLERTAGSMFRLGCASRIGAPPLHAPDFDIDERSLAIGARILARAAVRWCDPDQSYRAR